MNIKYAIKFILCYSPSCVKKLIQKVNKRIEKKRIIERMSRTKISKEEVKDILQRFNITGDVMLHASMVNIGDIDGGAKFVAEEILKRIDVTNHTLLVSALPYRGAFADYLKTDPIFDISIAPIAMGSVNRYLASLPNTIRSLHPTHSVVALGKDADYYVDGHFLDKTPFGIHSPYYKLIKNNGQVLLFGATMNNITCVCAVEDMLGEVYSNYLYARKSYTVKCINYQGNTVNVTTKYHDPKKAIKRDLSFIHDGLIKEGIMQSFKLGEAEVSLISIRDFAIYYLKLLNSGISNRGKIKVSPELHAKISEVIMSLSQTYS